MSDQFIGEIRLFSFEFAPQQWATCDGQALPVMQNQALYALIGFIYGGNNTTTFNLPDMRGRVMMHRAQEGQQGQAFASGTESVPLLLPQHQHTMNVKAATGTSNATVGNVLAQSADNAYTTASPGSTTLGNVVTSTGGNVATNNMQPSLVVNYCIALMGFFPSRN